MDTPIEPVAQPAPSIVQLCDSPSVWYLKHFLSDAECDYLINAALNNLTRSTVVDPTTGEVLQIDARSSSFAFFTLRQDEVITGIEERIAELTRMPVENGEGLQVINYKVGQEYKTHYDFFDPSHPGYQKAMDKGGQRVITVLMYLSDVEEGGETILPNATLSIKPEKGNALMFYNLYANGEPDFNTLHGSVPVVKGEKWVSTKWIRQGPYC